ncbi:START-like domain-containing protein [Reichenbachiella agarivorans]|uniref:START-like domain-containing protein n=1 Tax=Reichenbachiella agarivorans TaxID=2979464 RepID=A0ABY6CNP8_9BACT|nr:START-like domain-containing protein [Reichenbachiella agarivorans]UXP32154.1 START-like domain-containing protein [Reichenbachiella agarivorans]
MSKFKYVGEYEVRASKKMLYPYLSTASGLAQWFADNVNIDEDKNFTFYWDGEESRAQMTSHRTNSQVRFDFISDDEDPSYLEFKLDMNELTQEVFIRVTDYSDMDDEQELKDLWESLIHSLRELVGG